MRGLTHVAIGAVAPLGIAAHETGPMQCITIMVISAGSSLCPDIDHPNSTMTNALPRCVHRGVIWLSARARRVATPRDRASFAYQESKGRSPDHRALTHTGMSAMVAGGVTGMLSMAPLIPVVITMCAAFMGLRLAPRKYRRLAPIAVVGVGLFAWLAHLNPLMTGLAVGIGWMSSVIADGCTTAGVPLMWPLPIRGKRWWRMRFLGSRLKTGDPAEWWTAAVVAAIFVVIPAIILS